MSATPRTFRPPGLFTRHPAHNIQIDGASYSLPLHVYACDMHIISGTVNLAPLARLLAPEGLEPTPMFTRDGAAVGVAQLWLNDYRATSIGPYREVMVSFSVGAPRRVHPLRNFLSTLGPFADPDCAVLVRWLYLDQPLAIEVGRRVWGFPKQAGSLSFAADGARLVHETLDARGERVLRAEFTREHGPAATLRALAAMLPGLGPATTLRLLGERTHSALAITPRELKQTRARVRFQGWVDTFPWRGELRLGDTSPCALALRELAFAPQVVQRMPEVRFVMLEPI
jgi:Acetoacetate decarboxylase (ADC)